MLNQPTRRGVVAALLGAGGALAFDQDAPHQPISEDRIQKLERQSYRVEDFTASGLILDIGGGGEGIIGRIKGPQVVAIDLNRRELAEAPPGPLKIVMDATEMKFLDQSFSTATCFFTLMYMKPADQEKAMREMHRVLTPGGRLLLWDSLIPSRSDPKRDVIVFRFRFELPKEQVETGYGTFFPDRPHDRAYYAGLAETAGFRINQQREQGYTAFLDLQKAP